MGIFRIFYESFGKPSGLNKDDILKLFDGFEFSDYEYSEKEKEVRANEALDFLDSLPDDIVVYRAIRIKDVKEFRKDSLGDSWTIDGPTAYEFGSHAGCNYVIVGNVLKENVDMKQSAKSYLLFSFLGSSESEFELYIPFAEDFVQNVRLITMKEAKNLERYVGG